ncbi:MAG: hypothetical protein ACFB4I_02875 [Cyanophyceae cyanobacterium]
MSQPNYQEMSRAELKEYVLAHRGDAQALQELLSRPRPNAIYFPADLSIEEAEQTIQKRMNQANQSE